MHLIVLCSEKVGDSAINLCNRMIISTNIVFGVRVTLIKLLYLLSQTNLVVAHNSFSFSKVRIQMACVITKLDNKKPKQ